MNLPRADVAFPKMLALAGLSSYQKRHFYIFIPPKQKAFIFHFLSNLRVDILLITASTAAILIPRATRSF